MDRELPYKELNILGKNWKVKEISEKSKKFKDLCIEIGAENIWGTFDRNKRLLYIAKEAEYSDKLETLLHELLHIIVDEYEEFNVCKEEKNKQLSETLFDILSTNKIRLW